MQISETQRLQIQEGVEFQELIKNLAAGHLHPRGGTRISLYVPEGIRVALPGLNFDSTF